MNFISMLLFIRTRVRWVSFTAVATLNENSTFSELWEKSVFWCDFRIAQYYLYVLSLCGCLISSCTDVCTIVCITFSSILWYRAFLKMAKSYVWNFHLFWVCIHELCTNTIWTSIHEVFNMFYCVSLFSHVNVLVLLT